MQDLQTTSKEGNRCFHADVLKLLAIFLVVYNHTLGFSKGMYVAWGAPWSAFCKVGVPLFFMVSGAFLLGKTDGIGYHVRHRILRFLGVIALFYAIQVTANYLICDDACTFSDYCKYIIFGRLSQKVNPPAQWFLFAYLGFLFMVPVLRCTANSMTRSVAYYFIVVQIIIAAVVPVFASMVWGGMKDCVPLVLPSTPFKSSSSYIAFSGVVYIFYTLIGYMVEKKGLFTIKTPIQALLVGLGIVAVSVLEYRLSGHFGKPVGLKYNANYCFMTCLTAPLTIGTYALVRYWCSRGPRRAVTSKTVSILSGGVIMVFMTENIFRYLYSGMVPRQAPELEIIGWSLVLSLSVVVSALCLGIVLKCIPGLKSIL